MLDHVALLADYEAHAVVRDREEKALGSEYVVTWRACVGRH